MSEGSIDEHEKEKTKQKKSRIIQEAESYTSKLKRRGVIYLSRVPPFMKPNKARGLFETYGEVTRLFLAEEDPEARARRKRAGGNGSKQFKEGWIEYADKKIAKRVAESLNNTRISGKKGDFYHDDLWNLKYLKGFKWEYLTEKMAYERRIREAKLNATMKLAKKQNAEFAELVDKNIAFEKIEERKRRRGEAVNASIEKNDSDGRKKRKFNQSKSIGVHRVGVDERFDPALLKSLTGK